MELIALGSAGWVSSTERATACYAVRNGRCLLLLDAGTGVSRLIDRNSGLLDELDELHVLLSHFHLDHIIGLTYLTALPLPPRVTVWGPGPSYEGTSREILDRVAGWPFQPAFLSELHDIRDISLRGLEICGLSVEFRIQSMHSAPSFAMRINDQLTYCTDTAYDDGNIAFARHSEILLHEAWPASSGPVQGHTAPVEAALVAERAAVGTLVLCHVPPRADEHTLLSEAQAVFPHVAVARDGLRVEI